MRRNMRIILRKNDSATSLLLFIYNNYMVLTGEESIKLTSLLKFVGVFGKNESAVRMSLSRATKSGLLTNERKDGDVYYSLTEGGRKAILTWNEGVMQFWKRYRMRHMGWNGKWYFVNIQSSTENKETKTLIEDRLQQLGFTIVNSQTWVTPYSQNQEIKALVESFDMEDRWIEIYGEMTVHKDQDAFFDEVFGIQKLSNAYREFIETFAESFDETKSLYQDSDFAESGAALPILHGLGWNFFKIASEDVVLPKEILPQWEGDRAAAMMKEFREILLPAVNYFLQKTN